MCPYSKTADGFEMHIGVNHLGKKSGLTTKARRSLKFSLENLGARLSLLYSVFRPLGHNRPSYVIKG